MKVLSKVMGVKIVYFSSVIQFMSFPTIVVVRRFLEFYRLRIAIMLISFKSPCYIVLANFLSKLILSKCCSVIFDRHP